MVLDNRVRGKEGRILSLFYQLPKTSGTAFTVRDCYPISRVGECIDSLGDAKMFSALDSNTGY